FSLEEHGGKILVLEHRCPCCKTSSSSQDLGTTSKGCLDFSLEEHEGEKKILVLEHRCHCWRTSSSSPRFMDHFKGISGHKKDGKKKSNHVLGRSTGKYLICKRKRKEEEEKVGRKNKVQEMLKRMEKKNSGGPPSF
ncbi:hypothetical protein CDAR_220581, partial [Caerostris darwini]